MFSYLLSFIRGKNPLIEEIPSIDEAYSILEDTNQEESNNELAIEEKCNEIINNYETCTKKGRITKIKEQTIIIDNLYEYEMRTDTLILNSTVTYQILRSGSKVEVVDVEIINEEWNTINSENEKHGWCTRTVVCNVIERKGRILTLDPGQISVDLNKISSDFIPILGDWIELSVKCEIDESVTDLSGKVLTVDKLSPLRAQLRAGRITNWNSQTKEGTINNQIYFNQYALYYGYIPAKGDNIVAEIIESAQGNCAWRALKLIPDYLQKKTTELNNKISVNESELQTSHPSVKISENISINLDKLRETKSFLIDIENIGHKDLILESVILPKINTQCKIITKHFNYELKPDKTVTVKLECCAKTAGESREMIIFNFTDFKIQRWISINVKGDFQPKTNGVFNKYHNKVNIDRGKRDMIRGENVKLSGRFRAVRIPDYAVPKPLFNLFEHSRDARLGDLKEKVVAMKHCLTSALSYMNYEDKFHTLLYLEEIHSVFQMRHYDQERACFVKCNEYLLLEIENLAERRPSIIIGDHIIARDLYDKNKPDFQGIVHKVGKNHVFIKFSQMFHNSYNGEDYAVIMVASRTAFRREHHGIYLAMKNIGRDILFPSKVTEKDPQALFVYDPYYDKNQRQKPEARSPRDRQHLLEICHKAQVASGDKVTIPKLEWYNPALNFFQKEAVRNVLLGVCRPLPYLIFGPPGTGKTVTLVETVLQILRLIPHSRILVSAPSNSAADLLAERLIDSGVLKPGDLVRLVAVTAANSISAKLAPFTATGSIDREGTEIEQPFVTETGLTLGCTSKVLGRHRITVTTCCSAGTLYAMGLPRGHFSHIVIDEAGQTTEPSLMIPMSFLDINSGQVILAGDPMQLGPVIMSQLASEYGLEESYLERLISRFPYVRDIEGFPNSCGYDPRIITKLLYNYRSLPVLLKLPNTLFYNDDLLATISETDSPEAALLEKMIPILPTTYSKKTPSIIFHGVLGENYQTEESPSWFNPQEAAQVFYYVNELYRMGLKESDIGIISPYKAQMRHLVSLYQEAEFDIPKIGTVEEFQGQEYNVIILTTVRSDEKLRGSDVLFKLGFVASPRRLNVTITRAKVLLIIVGNPRLLAKDRYWRLTIEYCRDYGSYLGCSMTK